MKKFDCDFKNIVGKDAKKTALTCGEKNICTRNFAVFCFVQQQR